MLIERKKLKECIRNIIKGKDSRMTNRFLLVYAEIVKPYVKFHITILSDYVTITPEGPCKNSYLLVYAEFVNTYVKFHITILSYHVAIIPEDPCKNRYLLA